MSPVGRVDQARCAAHSGKTVTGGLPGGSVSFRPGTNVEFGANGASGAEVRVARSQTQRWSRKQNCVSDPVYMSRKIRKFRTDKFDT